MGTGESTLMLNGRIYPLNGIVPRVEAIAIRNGRVVRLGTNASVTEAIPTPDRVMDLKGKTVVPSFCDNLAWLGREALVRTQLDLTAAKNIPEIFTEVEKMVKQTSSGDWIVGYGWNKSQWGWVRFPHRADLDLVTPHHPVVLLSSDHRVAWLNTAALTRIGITRATPNPPGGEIERDETTQSATGILKETAVDLVREFLPFPPESAMVSAFKDVFADYLSKGVTSLQSFDSWEDLQILRKIDEEGQLPLKVTSHLAYSDFARAKEAMPKPCQYQNLRIKGLWVEVDGTLVSQTAHLLEPYADDWNRYGIEISSAERIEELLNCCGQDGWLPIFHASGDAACRNVVDAIQKYHEDFPEGRGMIVHGDLVDLQDLKRLPRMRMMLNTNPRRIESEREIGRTYWGNRWRQFLNLHSWMVHGVRLMFGSGEPLRHWSPMQVLQAAVHVADDRDPACALTVEQALVAMSGTVGQDLFATDQGHAMLSPGQSADLAILSEDPFAVSPDKISQIEIVATVLQGNLAYELGSQTND